MSIITEHVSKYLAEELAKYLHSERIGHTLQLGFFLVHITCNAYYEHV